VRALLETEWTDGTMGEWAIPDTLTAGGGDRNCTFISLAQDAAKVLAEPIILPSDIIDGVLHKGGKMVLGGSSKSYKTWLQIDLAVAIATGTECLNGYATEKGRVLFVNFELPAAFFHHRLQQVCAEKNVTIKPRMIDILNLRGRIFEWNKLQPQIPPDVYSLIILDPSYKLLLGRDENKAGDIASLVNEFKMLSVRTGAAVLFGAHYPKGNQAQKESIDRLAGSGVFSRDPDTILTFTQHEDYNAENRCFSVEMTLRNHPPKPSFVVRWQYPLFVVDGTLDPSRLKQTVGAASHSDPNTTAQPVRRKIKIEGLAKIRP